MSYDSAKAAPPMPDATTPLSPHHQQQPQQHHIHEQPAPAYQQGQYQQGQYQQSPQQGNYQQQGYQSGPYQQPMGAQPVAMVPGTATSVMFVQPGVAQFPPYPVHIRCPCCGAEVQTTVRKEAGALAWLSCGGLALLGCIFGCCLIPFCMDSFKDTEHWCPSCNRMIGKKSNL